jgi:hypothetical protein
MAYMKKNLFLFAAAIALLFTFSGCKKEDPAPKVKTGSVVFWQTKATSQENEALGAAAFYFYVAGKYQGSMGVGQFWNIAPDCGASGAITYKMDLGTSTQKTVSYEIHDQNGNAYYTGSITIEDNTCITLELQ